MSWNVSVACCVQESLCVSCSNRFRFALALFRMSLRMFLLSEAVEDRCCRCGCVQLDMAADDSPWDPLCSACCDALVVCEVLRFLRAVDLGPGVGNVTLAVLEFLPSRLHEHRVDVLSRVLHGEPWTWSPFWILDRHYLDVLDLRPRGDRYSGRESLTKRVISFLGPGPALSSQTLRCTCRGSSARCARCTLLRFSLPGGR